MQFFLRSAVDSEGPGPGHSMGPGPHMGPYGPTLGLGGGGACHILAMGYRGVGACHILTLGYMGGGACHIPDIYIYIYIYIDDNSTYFWYFRFP